MSSLFDLQGKVAIVTGGTGVLGGAMAKGLAQAGAAVAILGRREQRAADIARHLAHQGLKALPLPADVLNKDSLLNARDNLLNQTGHIDILVNAAGGNMAEATVVNELTFFKLEQDALKRVMALNLNGSVLPSQVFGESMVTSGNGSIINISSMAAQKPLSRVIGYAAAKAAIDNFTKWLAVELAQKYGEGLRVNAIAPGFFVGEQNRSLLLNADGSLTARGQQIISQTPMGRFGEADELIGTAVYLASDAAKFVTGVVIPVDGGFSAFGGI
jgi:NAD(P)-dependent dehydrogenase (short-subunit alcohol dehydrogenase family)